MAAIFTTTNDVTTGFDPFARAAVLDVRVARPEGPVSYPYEPYGQPYVNPEIELGNLLWRTQRRHDMKQSRRPQNKATKPRQIRKASPRRKKRFRRRF